MNPKDYVWCVSASMERGQLPSQLPKNHRYRRPKTPVGYVLRFPFSKPAARPDAR